MAPLCHGARASQSLSQIEFQNEPPHQNFVGRCLSQNPDKKVGQNIFSSTSKPADFCLKGTFFMCVFDAWWFFHCKCMQTTVCVDYVLVCMKFCHSCEPSVCVRVHNIFFQNSNRNSISYAVVSTSIESALQYNL